MDQTAQELAKYPIDRLERTPSDTRILVGLGGVPGLATLIVTHFTSEQSRAYGSTAVAVSIDGWLLTLGQLDSLPDPQHARKNRGVHWTFDALGMHPSSNPFSQVTVLTAPGCYHSVPDPIKDSLAVQPTDRIVNLEGIYAFFTLEPWIQAGEVLDERWLIDEDPDEAKRRVIQRNFETGVTNLEEATRSNSTRLVRTSSLL
ncbi:hypothetical protein BD410DRAFT_723030 [Rickenella mellea]|uniref:Uncharacterized protein n=1 Tax=Rickenella mellea TaxID=50990 RepID=A0A4Y7Q4Z2_9AGAM|nr:hypothetical protein BD410DRAFT_723030 [Rickenella mellea]